MAPHDAELGEQEPTRPASPSISVVIPVKNDAPMLERCLEALSAQTRAPLEIVVVDNDSHDITPHVATWWGARCIRELTPGIPAAASAGYDAADGDIIARLDADSVPSADWLARIEASFAEDPDLVAVTGPGRFASLTRPWRLVADLTYMRAYFAVFGVVIGHPPVFGSNFAMTRPAWQEARQTVHRRDREVHDDLDLSFGLPRAGTVRVDRSLVVQISARPLADPRGFVRRVLRGVHTVLVNRRAIVSLRRRAPEPRAAR